MKKPPYFFCVLTTLFFFLSPLFASAKEAPFSVLIVGGGPAGLATAIEAHQLGANVTVIEKRKGHSRMQTVFLTESSLELLARWNIDIIDLKVIDFGQNRKMGVVKIKDLEDGLDKRVNELDIKKLTGEFVRFGKNKNEAVVSLGGSEVDVHYDVIVAADGAWSRIRNLLGIKSNCVATAVGAWVFVPFKEADAVVDVSPFIKKQDHYIRKITVPWGSIILLQSYAEELDAFKLLTPQTLKEEVLANGWEREGELIDDTSILLYNDIGIELQQAQTFSDKTHAAILIGDAAATGSFFHGMGVNSAFKTAIIATEFFKMLHEKADNAYEIFNIKMEAATDELLDYSKFLLVTTCNAVKLDEES